MLENFIGAKNEFFIKMYSDEKIITVTIIFEYILLNSKL